MRTLVIGDLHGHFDTYRRLLQQARLIDEADHWSGGESVVWLVGDLFDRGPLGIQCLRLTRQLQEEAGISGGQVDCLLGNHELMLLAARNFPTGTEKSDENFVELWLDAGGQTADLVQLQEEEAEWLRQRPAMALLGDYLLLHADATNYLNFGLSITKVNENFTELIHSNDQARWLEAIRVFSMHGGFCDPAGPQRAEQMLKLFGGRQLVHGHTPIPLCNGQPAETVVEPWVYAGGRCCNVDGGLYLGGPGFVYELNEDLIVNRPSAST